MVTQTLSFLALLAFLNSDDYCEAARDLLAAYANEGN